MFMNLAVKCADSENSQNWDSVQRDWPFKNIKLKDMCKSQPLVALKIIAKNFELMQMVISFLK